LFNLKTMNVAARIATSHGSVRKKIWTTSDGTAQSNRSKKASQFDSATSTSCSTTIAERLGHEAICRGECSGTCHPFLDVLAGAGAGDVRMAAMTSPCSASDRLDPLGRHKPVVNSRAATVPPRTVQSRKIG
jgi:hypothetical protein